MSETANNGNENGRNITEAALAYTGLGMRLVSIPPHAAKAVGKGSILGEASEITEAEIGNWFRDGGELNNIAFVPGEHSGWIVDVDLDHDLLAPLADALMTDTDMVFGRPGRPRSHRLYRVPDARFRELNLLNAEGGKEKKVLEIRATASTEPWGTMLPPSEYPANGRYAWEEFGEPGNMKPDRLERECREVVTALAIMLAMPDRGDGRHYFLLPVLGYLLRPGRFGKETATRLLKAAADINGHQREEERRTFHDEVERAAKSTVEKLEVDEPVQGGGELEKQAPGLAKTIAALWGWEKKEGRGGNGRPTDDELADRWLDAHPDRAYGQGEWKAYGNGIWVPVFEAEVEWQVKRVLIAAKQEGIRPTAALVSGVERLARMDVAVHDDLWDSDPDILVCQNGTLHIPTGELQPHKTEHYATRAVPYDFDPEATAPTWGRFLGDFVDAETAHFLQEFAGYCLTTDTGHEIALWLTGKPGGGRSTFLAGMRAMLGEKAGTMGLGEIERSQFALARIPGKTLLVSAEQPVHYVKASNLVNELISGDPIQVEEKYKPAYEVVPRAKICWAMNDLPRIPSANDGLFRRVKVVKITQIPEGERDPEIKKAIGGKYGNDDDGGGAGEGAGEGAGILNWALQGLERLRERGRFELPEAVRDDTHRWQLTNDIPALFVAEACDTGEGKQERGGKLYQTYKRWCENNGYKPKANRTVAEDWERLGFTSDRDKNGIVWRGIEVCENSLSGLGNVPF